MRRGTALALALVVGTVPPRGQRAPPWVGCRRGSRLEPASNSGGSGTRWGTDARKSSDHECAAERGDGTPSREGTEGTRGLLRRVLPARLPLIRDRPTTTVAPVR